MNPETQIPPRVIIYKQDRIDYIIRGVCDYYGITKEELLAYRKTKKFLRKKIAIKLLHDIADIGFREIGIVFGRRSTNSIFLAYQDISEDLAIDTFNNEGLKQEYKSILKHLGL